MELIRTCYRLALCVNIRFGFVPLVELSDNNGMEMGMHCEAWHKRQAVQIAAQLPEKAEDALIVLALCRELVEGFLSPQRADLGGAVVPFRSAPPNSPSRLASSTGNAAGLP